MSYFVTFQNGESNIHTHSMQQLAETKKNDAINRPSNNLLHLNDKAL